jgi:hypothetical protein
MCVAPAHGQVARLQVARLHPLAEVCNTYGQTKVVFVGRLGEPATFHMSGQPEIEKARQNVIRTETEVARRRASLARKATFEEEREFAIAIITAQDEFARQRTIYPPPYDLTLFPVVVEQPFRGVTEPTLMVHPADPSLKMQPGELYLISGERSNNYIFAFPELAKLVPVDEYVETARATAVTSALQELRFFTSTAGGTVLGTLTDRSGTPLPGIRIVVSAGTAVRETTTIEDGSFIASGIESGVVTLKPLLNDDLGVVNTSALTFQIVEGGCKSVDLIAALNGRVSGRIISAAGKPLNRVEVVLQRVDIKQLDQRRLAAGFIIESPGQTREFVRANEDGTFHFSGQTPGDYLLSATLEILMDGKARSLTTFYPGTPDAAAAVPITIGRATQHDGFDFLVTTE